MDVVVRLLACGSDLHVRNGKGWCAVHSAASNGYFEVVLRLVQVGAGGAGGPMCAHVCLLGEWVYAYRELPWAACTELRLCPRAQRTGAQLAMLVAWPHPGLALGFPARSAIKSRRTSI